MFDLQQASRLLEAVLQSGLFSIARDICRFVRSIDPLDMLSPIAANTPAALKQHKPSAVLMRKGTIVDDAATQAFVYPPHFCMFYRVLKILLNYLKRICLVIVCHQLVWQVQHHQQHRQQVVCTIRQV